jgi:hypothetical protein
MAINCAIHHEPRPMRPLKPKNVLSMDPSRFAHPVMTL